MIIEGQEALEQHLLTILGEEKLKKSGNNWQKSWCSTVCSGPPNCARICSFTFLP